jgi:two-component sensor histidine kinase
MPEWTLPSETASIPLARQLATDAFPGLSRDSLDSIAMVVSELATNCVRHAGTVFSLRVGRPEQDLVRIDVRDDDAAQPVLRNPTPAQLHGRGLRIVQALARQWGVLPATRGVGKTVWCTVAV